MTITLTKQHLFATLFILLFFSFSFSWYLFPSFYWLLGPATAITVVSAIAYWLTHRENDGLKQRKIIEKQDKTTMNRLFKLLLRELKDRGQFKQKYRLPWYLFISHNIQADSAVLSQMGFRRSSVINTDNQLAIQVWLKNNAVILAVNLSGDDYRALNCIKLLLASVKRFRSRQALNGILLSQSIGHLLSKDKTQNKEMATDSRVIIDEAQQLCGQQLPLYVLFNQMADLADFCQYFSSLEEHHLDGCFGAMNSASLASGAFTLSWFNTAFDNLCTRMGKAIVFALDHQLNETFRRSVIAAPAQLRQVKNEISFYLSELLLAKPSSQAYQFRGFFFTNTENNAAVIDPLTKRVAYQLDHHEMVVADGVKLSHSIFVTELFNRFIRPEAGFAQVNRVRKRLLLSLQVTFWLLIITLMGSTAGLLKANFDYYQSLNTSTIAKLDRYNKDIHKTPYREGQLIQNIARLGKINKIYRDYEQPTPAYISDLIPNPSLFPALEKTYQRELSNIVLPSLVFDIETKLRTHQQSGDVLQTAKFLTLLKALKNHSQADWQTIKSYYQQVILDDDKVLNELLGLMDDLYAFGIPKATVNKKLMTEAELTISSKNNAYVIFDYIKNLPQFLSVVDINGELGNNFQQLLRIKDRAMLQVPFIYTPQGFAALNLNSNAPLIKEVIADNKSLLGEDLNEFQINNLVQQLQRMYQREYIRYWRDFISSISLKPLLNENLNYSLDLLVNKTDAPLNQLFDVISYYTSPKLQSLIAETAAPSDTDKLTSPLLKEKKQPVQLSDEQREMEKAIQDEFSNYHSFIKTDENGISTLSNLVAHFSKVNEWLDKANESSDIAAEYYQQLTSPDKDQSLYKLSQIETNIEQIDNYNKSLIRLVNANIRKVVTAYIDEQWRLQISEPFSGLFAKKFPFNIKSESDANLKQFNRYFKLGGLFDKYKMQSLSKFKLRDERMFLNGFLPNDAFYISTNALAQLENLDAMQQVLYQQGKKQFSIPFKLNIKSMSAMLLKFELFSQRTLMSYQHGPKLWRKFVWPDLTTQSELLAIFTDTKGQKNTINYNGDWAWLRLIYQNYQANPSQTEIKLSQGSNDVSLIVAVESDESPLEPKFFSQFMPPKNLIAVK